MITPRAASHAERRIPVVVLVAALAAASCSPEKPAAPAPGAGKALKITPAAGGSPLPGRVTIRSLPPAGSTPRQIEVEFRNGGSTPLYEHTVRMGCAYFVDGLRCQRRALFALSCLGGCPHVEPGGTMRFEVPLAQLGQLHCDGGGIPSRGAHQIQVVCNQIGSNLLEVHFDDNR